MGTAKLFKALAFVTISVTLVAVDAMASAKTLITPPHHTDPVHPPTPPVLPGKIDSDNPDYLEATDLTSENFPGFTVVPDSLSSTDDPSNFTVELRGMIFDECLPHFKVINSNSNPNEFTLKEGNKNVKHLGFKFLDSEGGTPSHPASESGLDCQQRLLKAANSVPSNHKGRKHSPCGATVSVDGSAPRTLTCTAIQRMDSPDHPSLTLTDRNVSDYVRIFSANDDSGKTTGTYFQNADGADIKLHHVSGADLADQNARNQREKDDNKRDAKLDTLCRDLAEGPADQIDANWQNLVDFTAKVGGDAEDFSDAKRVEYVKARFKDLVNSIAQTSGQSDLEALFHTIADFAANHAEVRNDAADACLAIIDKITDGTTDPSAYTSANKLLNELAPLDSKKRSAFPLSKEKKALVVGHRTDLKGSLANLACQDGETETCVADMQDLYWGKGGLADQIKACNAGKGPVDCKTTLTNEAGKVHSLLVSSHNATVTLNNAKVDQCYAQVTAQSQGQGQMAGQLPSAFNGAGNTAGNAGGQVTQQMVAQCGQKSATIADNSPQALNMVAPPKPGDVTSPSAYSGFNANGGMQRNGGTALNPMVWPRTPYNPYSSYGTYPMAGGAGAGSGATHF